MTASGWISAARQGAYATGGATGGEGGAGSLSALLYDFATRPGVLEAGLAVALLACAWIVCWRAAGLIRRARSRRALLDYLLGVEQALQGDLAGAQKRLASVLEQDPENHYARLQLGKVLGELGRSEEAHQHHLYLQTAFEVDSSENELLLAQSLLAERLPAEAVAVAERAMARAPENMSGWRFLYEARLQLGDAEGAARTGRRLLAAMSDASERRRFSAELAETWVTVGTRAWRAGDRKKALTAARDAAALGAPPRLPLLEARLRSDERGVGAVARELATAPPAAAALTPVDAPAPPPAPLPVATFAGLLEPARWTCRSCEVPLPDEVLYCKRCGAAAPADLVEPALLTPLESPTEAMDQIDVNDAHLRRLVRAALDGRPGAAEELDAVGDVAVPELLRAGLRADGSERTRAIQALQDLGPASLPALFEAARAAAPSKIWGGGEGPEPLLAATVQGWGRDALPFIEPLFRAQRPEQLRVLVDYFLSLADLDAFQTVLERVPPMDVLHRLNQSSRPVLRRFLQAVPPGHFLAETMLLEPTFYRDEVLFDAVDGAPEPKVLIEVIHRRGPTRTLVTALITALADSRRSETAAGVLIDFGEPVLEHCLAAYTNPEAEAAAQQPLEHVLTTGGAPAARLIVDGFGPTASASDDRLRGLLRAIGDDAVPALVDSYERAGWLEKVSAGLVSRHNNRRVQILRALGELSSPAALQGLRGLASSERDDNLRIHLQRALHDAGAADA